MNIEEIIKREIAKGTFDNLKGAGKPLKLDDDRAVPEEYRMAYRFLKNSGYVPEEVAGMQALKEARAALEGMNEEEKAEAKAKISAMESLINLKRERLTGKAVGAFAAMMGKS